MFPKPRAPQPEALPSWAEGQITLFAFQALKQAKTPHGYAGKPATMRKLADKGLVQQVESGAYVITEAGKQLVEGYITCPPDIHRRMIEREQEQESRAAYPIWPSAVGPVKVAEGEHAGTIRERSYTVQRVTGGCEVIRLVPRRRLRLVEAP